MTATTGSGGLSGPGNWVGLGAQGSGLAEGAGQAAMQSRLAGAMPSSTALVQTARTALAAAQAQQADVMLTLSEGAKTLLGGTLLGNGSAASAFMAAARNATTQTATQAATQTGVQAGAQAASTAEQTPVTAGSAALVADMMHAADTVLANPAATVAQKAMATQVMQMATAMAAQSTSGGANGIASGGVDLPLLQSLGAQEEASGVLGGAVVTTSGLYGLASSTVQDSSRVMASALASMADTQAEEIVLPGGIVQLPQDTAGGVNALLSASSASVGSSLTNALSTALLPDLFKALSAVLANPNATDVQKAAATALLQMLDTAQGGEQVPQALLNPLLAAALMPALSPSQRGRMVRAALAEDVEDMGRLEEAEQSGQPGAAGLRAALRKNAAYLDAVQKPLLDHVLQISEKQEELEAAAAGWGAMGLSREQIMEDALGSSSILAFSQNLMADSPYMGALASTSLTPILIMSWAALLSGCLPRAYPFVPRVWRRANKKRWCRKNQRQKMDLQNLLFTGDAVQA